MRFASLAFPTLPGSEAAAGADPDIVSPDALAKTQQPCRFRSRSRVSSSPPPPLVPLWLPRSAVFYESLLARISCVSVGLNFVCFCWPDIFVCFCWPSISLGFDRFVPHGFNRHVSLDSTHLGRKLKQVKLYFLDLHFLDLHKKRSAFLRIGLPIPP